MEGQGWQHQQHGGSSIPEQCGQQGGQQRQQQPMRSFSSRLVEFFSARNQSGTHDEILHLLKRDGSKKMHSHIRLYLALHCLERGCNSSNCGGSSGGSEIAAQTRHQHPNCDVQVLKLESSVAPLYADRLFDCSDRILPLVKVKFCHNSDTIDHQVIRHLAISGFTFLDEQFHFFAFKDLGTEFAYFVPLARTDYETSVSLWQSIANFVQLPHVPVMGMRLGLLVSGACFGFRRKDVDLRVFQDIRLDNSDRAVLTDGSGFISSDLAHQLPLKVQQGVAVDCTRNNTSSGNGFLPYAYQVRVFSSQQGIFKGTLVVDVSLPARTLIVRESMRKVSPSLLDVGIDTHTVSVEVVNTACNAHHGIPIDDHQVLETTDRNDPIETEATSQHSGDSQKSGHLNRFLILLLHSNGVSEQVFQELVRKHATLALSLTRNRTVALQYCSPPRHPKAEVGDDNTGHNSTNLHAILRGMIAAGHSLNEPYLNASLVSIQQREIRDLLGFRVRCEGCSYLMGIPDPTSLLYLDEVFIPGWASEQDAAYSDNNDHGHEIGGCHVVVSRFPLHDERALVKFLLLSPLSWLSNDDQKGTRNCEVERMRLAYRSLTKYFAFSSGVGVIVFGTKVRPGNAIPICPVKPMGGDYDGDIYFVCSYQPIVDSFIPALTNTDEGCDTSSICDSELDVPNFDHKSSLNVESVIDSFSNLYLSDFSIVPALSMNTIPLEREGDGLCNYFSSSSGLEDFNMFESSLSCMNSSVDNDEPPLMDPSISCLRVEGCLMSTPVSTTSLPFPCKDDTNLSCSFLTHMTMSPRELLALSCKHLVESLIWEWLSVDIHALGKHTNLDVSPNFSSLNAGELTTEAGTYSSFIICDHSSSPLIQSKLCYFEHSSKLISKCAINWIVEADLNGPSSTLCRQYASLHDKCLMIRKLGYQLFDDISSKNDGTNMDQFPTFPPYCPHYMNLSSTSAKGKPALASCAPLNSYHSTSVLGRMFDFIQLSVMAAEKDMSSTSNTREDLGVVLDSDYNIDTMLCPCDEFASVDVAENEKITKHRFLQAAADMLARYNDQSRLLYSHLDGIYHVRDDYEKKSILGGSFRCTQHCQRIKSELVAFFRNQFESVALKLESEFNQRSKSTVFRLSTGVSQEHYASVSTRWKLAVAVYEVAYMQASQLRPSGEVLMKAGKRGGDTFSFQRGSARNITAIPWTLCGNYLNQIKRHAMQESIKSSLSDFV